jgi:hypothetical protein
LPGTPILRAPMHTRSLGMASARAGKRLKTAENRRIEGRPQTAAPAGPDSRRLRRNGRFGSQCDDRPPREKREARAVQIEIGPVYGEWQDKRADEHLCAREHSQSQCADGSIFGRKSVNVRCEFSSPSRSVPLLPRQGRGQQHGQAPVGPPSLGGRHLY